MGSKKKKSKKSKKVKKPLTAEQKRAKRARRKWRRENFDQVFINGKRKFIRKPPMIDGIPADEFYARNADSITLTQDGDYHLLEPPTTDDLPLDQQQASQSALGESVFTPEDEDEDDIPF